MRESASVDQNDQTAPIVDAGRSGDPVTPGVQPALHGLARNSIGLVQSVVISIASSAPTAAMSVTFAGIVVASAGGAAIAVLITVVPMLVIAYSFMRLNRWEANCGAQYIWVGRSAGPRLGYMTGWIVLAALMFGTVATVLPVGPSFLELVGLNSSSQLGAALSATALSAIVAVLAILGITLTAWIQIGMAIVEYLAVGVLTIIGLWKTFVTQPHGFVHPTLSWLSPTGVGGKGSLVATLLLAVFLIAGWDASLYVNEETEKAKVNPGRAVITSVIALGVFYTLMLFAFQAVGTPTQINAHAAQGLSFAGDRVAGHGGEKVMSLAVLLSAVATTQVGLLAVARVSYAMGTDKLLPDRFATLHPRYKTPAFGTALFALVTILVVWASVFSSSVANAFGVIVGTTGVLYATFYAIGALTNTWYFRAQIRTTLSNAFLIGVLPVAAAGYLVWVIAKSVVGFSTGENVTLLAILASGVLMTIYASRIKRSPFFGIKRVKDGDEA